jgi:single-strand DNA-binding protein
MGRLTRDPELRHTQAGTAVASFTIAIDRPLSSRDGAERQADFIDCTAWDKRGEFVSKYFTKGQMIAVSGRLQIRDWTDKDGNKRRSAEVVVDNSYFTESKRSRDAAGISGGSSGGGDYAPAPKNDFTSGYTTPVAGSDFAELDDVDDGDLPF